METFTTQALEDLQIPLPHSDTAPLAAKLIALGHSSLLDAMLYVRKLPYGRCSEGVLMDGCGTCSSKHALLANLAAECNVGMILMLGIFEMDEENTPGVGEVLSKYGLHHIPEAHCYLRLTKSDPPIRLDFTRRENPIMPNLHFLEEIEIAPNRLSKVKIPLHRKFLTKWNKVSDTGYSNHTLWKIREECIAALSRP